MKDIAFKKEGLLWAYFVALAALIFLVIIDIVISETGFKGIDKFRFFIYLIMGGVCLYIVIRIISLPKVLIKMDDDNNLYLYTGEKINAKDITDVSYKVAYGRGFTYRWGKLTIFTSNKIFTIPYMADVEDVGKKLLLLSQRLKIKGN